jgi:hypothetical protein
MASEGSEESLTLLKTRYGAVSNPCQWFPKFPREIRAGCAVEHHARTTTSRGLHGFIPSAVLVPKYLNY